MGRRRTGLDPRLRARLGSRLRARAGGRTGARARRKHGHHRLRLIVLAVALAITVAIVGREAMRPGPWQRVYATREGLTGGRLASGDIIRPGAMFVALPDRSALRRDVELRYRDRIAVVPVLDVGPWNTDDAYWSTGQRPAAERGRGTFRTPVNRAGIDLSDAVFLALGLTNNDYLEWRFVHRGYIPLPHL